jgi:AcrR family transcriptional regulator
VKKRPDLLSNEKLPAQPVQQRSIASRERLKKAALAEFGKRGFMGAGIQEIAAQAGVAAGAFYQHFASKRQLLLVLMDELLEGLTQVELRESDTTDVRAGIRQLLAAAFARDRRYLGAYRAWREAVLSDPELLKLDRKIHEWSVGRITALFDALSRAPGARTGVDGKGLARAMDGFFWGLLGEGPWLSKERLADSLDAATHLIYHAMFRDR